MEPATTDLSVALVEHTNFAVSDRAGDAPRRSVSIAQRPTSTAD